MSSEQDNRRRPFSVNDMNRRTREVKIFNTTTITTTTSTSSHDSSILTTTITNRGIGHPHRSNDSNYANVHYDQPIIISSTSRPHDHRSRSAYEYSPNGENININSEYRDSRHTTNSTTTVPGKRKIKFVYGGDDQQNADPNSKILKEKSSDYETTTNPKTSPILNERIRYQYENSDPVTNETNLYSSNENLPGFPYVTSSLSHQTSDAIITNSVVINNRCREGSRRGREVKETAESYENNEKYDNKDNAEKDDTSECNMVVKDVEVECEIDEDPSIFEGSEGYVKNLISKIQNQYKNPETVHIKITRRQKPENIDKSGNIIKKSENESYGQIVRKEYYTLKASPKHRKRTNISSFVDTTNIPFIDDEADSKRNSRAYDYEHRGPTPPNYIIEKHIIYSDCENEQNEITQVIKTVQRKSLKERNEEEKTKKRRGVRSLVKTLSRSGKKDKSDKQGKRFESESPTRASKKKKDYLDSRDISLPNVDVKTQKPRVTVEHDIDSVEVKGIKGFFKGFGGKIKAPEVEPRDLYGKKEEISLEIDRPTIDTKPVKIELQTRPVKTDYEIGLPNVDVDLQGPRISGPSFDADVDINAPDVKGGIKGFFKGIGGKIKAPDVHIPDVSVKTPKIDVPDLSLKGPKIDVPDVNLRGPKFETPDLSFKTPKFEAPDLNVRGPKVELPEIAIETGLPNVDVDLQGPRISGPSFDADVDINAPDVKGGIKGFFKGIGGKIKAPDVHIPDVSVKTPRYELPDVSVRGPQIDSHVDIRGPKYENLDSSLIITPHTFPDVSFKSDLTGEGRVLQGSMAKPVPKTFGFDLPMTIVNNDWHWSTESSKNGNSDRRIFHRTFVDYAESTSSHIGSGTFAIGDMNYYQNTDFTSTSSKKLEVEHYVTRPQGNATTNFTPPSIEYEFKKAKIRKDPQFFTTTSANVNTNPGDIILTAPSTSETASSQVKSSSSGFFRRKLSSSSSSTNINNKKGVQTSKSSTTRSESMDPSRRTKIDYSLPRKCYLFTQPDFNGLGIHIACDKKSRRSPYIHEVEADSPGSKAGLRKHDYILQVNDEDAVNMDFAVLISKIQNLIKENNLCLTVGNEKAYKKWIKINRSKTDKSSSDDKSKK